MSITIHKPYEKRDAVISFPSAMRFKTSTKEKLVIYAEDAYLSLALAVRDAAETNVDSLLQKRGLVVSEDVGMCHGLSLTEAERYAFDAYCKAKGFTESQAHYELIRFALYIIGKMGFEFSPFPMQGRERITA